MSDNSTIIHSLYKIGALKFGNFTLKSGQSSSIYLNLRVIISYPILLREIANLIWDKIKNCQFKLICGVPYTALPLATCLSLDHNIPMVLRRKEKKDYGTKQIIEGVYTAGDTCLIVEDIITTGSSILETADELKNVGLLIHDVVALISREKKGINELATHFQPHFCFTLQEMLSTLLHSNLLSKEESAIVSAYMRAHE